MSTYTAIGLLIVLSTICTCVGIITWFSSRAAAQNNVLTHMAALQGVTLQQEKS